MPTARKWKQVSNLNKVDYRFGFNGQEKDDEVSGAGNSMTAEFWQYDSRLGRRWNIDPELKNGEGSYTTFSCNPIWFSDPLGNTAGDYYSSTGEHLGSDNIDDKKTYKADEVTKDESGKVIGGKGIVDLKINHDKFIRASSTVYGESSLTGSELKEEMYALASVHKNYPKEAAYGAYGKNARIFRSTSLVDRNKNPRMKLAIAAEINALLGGFDYSFGARYWDGKDQAIWSTKLHGNESHVDFNGGKKNLELHMNTRGWTMSDDLFKRWGDNIGKNFRAPKEREATVGNNKGNITLQGTAVYGNTIFWKENE